METLIQGTIAALGFLEDGNYYQEPDCFESIRDLIRFLRNDTDDLIARRICGERNIVENDLIHIMKAEQNNEKMFDIVLRLIANLVQPAAMSMLGKPPQDRESYHILWSLEENLRRTKSAFTDPEFFIILKKKLEKYFLYTDWDDRTEDQKLVMERIIVLIRYIFAIPCGKGDDRRTKMETNTHDRVISAFVDSKISEVLAHIASTSSERDFHLSILQIIGYVVKEHTPSDIVSTFQGRSREEKSKAEEEMKMIFENEMNKDKALKRNVLSSRHTRFAGSYVVKGVQAVNRDNDFVVHKVVKDITKITFNDERKVKKRIAKNRRPFESSDKTHTSSIEVRLQLKSFVELILSKAFNVLMKNSKELAFNARSVLGQKNSDVHYFLVMRFFLEYARLAKLSTSSVSSCLGIEAFHHLQIQLEEALENAAAQRKEAKGFGIKAQYAVSAYKELILTHQNMLDNGSPDERELAQRTCDHILKVEEYRDLTSGVMRRFMPGAFSKGFLRELVLSSHHYLRLLEVSVKTGNLTTVSKKQKKRKARKPANKKQDEVPKPNPVDNIDGEELDSLWSDIAEELSDCIIGYLDPATDKSPINSLLDVTDEQHQQFAMLYIQRALREENVQNAVGLYRNSREIWYDEGIFGEKGMTPEEEFCEIREIFFGDLKEISSALLTAETVTDEKFRGKEVFDDEGGNDSEDEERIDYETKEVSFDFDEYVGKYARTEVLRWYVYLLGEFDVNSSELNKALVKMLHRVSFDLKMPSRLYQLSLFRIFSQVNEKLKGFSQDERKRSPLFELYTFGYHLLKRYLAAFAEIGDKLAPEILFWKGAKESFEIENKYETKYEHRDIHKMKWPEDLEDEVRSLHSEYMSMEERPTDLDVLDFIEHNMTQPRTRRQIHRKLRDLGLETLGAKINKGSAKERSFPIIDFKDFIDEYNASETLKEQDLVDYLRNSLSEAGKGEYSRQKIIKQLAYVGCPYEKKKKPSAKREKSQKKKKDFIANSDSENENNSGESEEEEEDDEEEMEDEDLNKKKDLNKNEKQIDEESDLIRDDISDGPAEPDPPVKNNAVLSDITNEESSKISSVLIDSDDEMGDAGARMFTTELPPAEPVVITASKKRKRVVISDDEDEGTSNGFDEVAPSAKQSDAMRQSASPGASPVRPKKKISRIIDSDDEV